jgi:hypothetical protein
MPTAIRRRVARNRMKQTGKRTSTTQRDKSFLQRSSLYREFLAEREEILRHKWIESEKAGKDIGFERALLDWIRKHRDGWRESRRSENVGS